MTSAIFVVRAEQRETEARARDLTGGDPERGRILARSLGCVACHTIPGVMGPRTAVGPSLEDFGKRPFIAGATENTAQHLTQFLLEPRSVAPKTAMPNLRLCEAHARDVGAFLYTLR